MAITNPGPLVPPTASRVSPETVEKAVNALLKWRNSKSQTQKPQLLEQDDFVYLILTLKKIPSKGRTNPHKISLPHALCDPEQSELCLIIDDRPKSNLTSKDAKKKIKSENIPVSKVLKLSKLKSDYRPFEAKRKLCNSYDVFLADKRVIPLLPRLLGKQFFKKKKIPVPVDLTHKNWKEQVDKVCGSALLYLRTGTCSVLKVGKASMEREEIVENVVAAINGVVEIVPKKWGNVRSFHLKLLDSLALPVYQSAPDVKLKIEGFKEKEEDAKRDEKENFKVDGKIVKKKAAKKGRIHEVRYMDSNIGELFDEDELDNDDGGGVGEGEGEDSENNKEMSSGDFGGKKRKKGGDKMKGGNEKRVKKVAKVKNDEGIKKKKDKLFDEDELDNDDGGGVGEGEGEDSENNKEMSSGDFGGKKRKKGGDKMKGGNEKGVKKVAKVKNDEGIKKKKDKLFVKGGEESGAKEKSGLKKLKSGALKVGKKKKSLVAE